MWPPFHLPLASAADVFIWLLIAAGWIVIQMANKGASRGRAERGKPPRAPASDSGAEPPSDLDAFIEEMKRQAREAVSPPPVPRPSGAPPLPRATQAPLPRAVPAARSPVKPVVAPPVSAAKPAKPPPSARKPAAAVPSEPAEVPGMALEPLSRSSDMVQAVVLSLPDSFTTIHAQRSMLFPAITPGVERRKTRASPLVSDLKRPFGLRRGFVLREVLGAPVGLR